ncbi:Putative UDP-glucuronosyltransferase ugt-50 [Toxocara canis]|uniref:glucuronosyltransferase n=1 Tax=Toxocara canis TaxID=6265 RepID=A0A0B2VAY0_TOXCA|nr:Putative UDP-glucuronosyltransferase ugt-50 [Toxocara canis]
MNAEFLLFVLIAIHSSNICAKQMKFLFYSPSLGHSHLQFVGTLADFIVDAGHIAHVLIPDLGPHLKENGTAKAQRVIRITPSRPSPYTQFDLVKNAFMANVTSFDSKSFQMLTNMSLMLCEDILNDDRLIDELRAERYDLGFTELYDYCPLGILHHVGVKSIALLSAVSISDLLADSFGLPSPSSYVISWYKPFISAPELSFLERLENFVSVTAMRIIHLPQMLMTENMMFRRLLGPNFPDLRLLARNASAAFINTLHIFDLPRPISSKVIFIGGISVKKPSTLSKQFSDILDRPNSRVVLFSLGSITRTKAISFELKLAFLEAFAHFPEYDFIMKLDVDPESAKLIAKYRNVHYFKWIDQVNILKHPSTKAFITHAGANSMIEAMFSAVPLVCIPLFGDQYYNAVVATRKNVAVFVDKTTITSDKLIDALDKVLNDSRYAENSRILREKLEKYPLNSKELFIKWSEYLAEFGDFTDLNLYAENSRILREKLEKYPLNSKELFIKWSEYLAEFGDFTDLNLYAENSRILREKLEKYPLNSKELFIKWSEYLAEFGDFTDLNLYGTEMGFFTYYLLDIFFVLFTVIVCLLFIVIKIIAMITEKIRMMSKKKTE